MSDLKSKQVFEQPLEQPEQAQEDLTVQQVFANENDFVPQTVEPLPEELASEQKIEHIIRPKKRGRWLWSGGLVVFAGLLGWQAIDTFLSAVASGQWLSVAWAGFVAAIAGLGVGAFGKELWKLRRLRRHFNTQDETERLLQSDSVGKGREFCQKIANDSNINQNSAGYVRWQQSIAADHSDAEVIEMFDAMVVSEQDKLATKLVTKYATEAATLVAISPLAIADMLLVAWRNFKMIDALADIYGVELGYWSRLKLFKLVLINMAAIGASDLVIDASMDLVSMDLARRVSARAGQGIGIGILTARLGIKAVSLLRPIPWQEGKAVKLSTIRKQIVQKIASIAVKS